MSTPTSTTDGRLVPVLLLTFGMLFMITGPSLAVQACGGILWVLAVALIRDNRATRAARDRADRGA